MWIKKKLRKPGCLVLIALAVLCLAYLGFEIATFPNVTRLPRENPKDTAWMKMRDEEAAALAAVIINPRRYSPIHPNKRIKNRIALIQARMQKYRYYR